MFTISLSNLNRTTFTFIKFILIGRFEVDFYIVLSVFLKENIIKIMLCHSVHLFSF